MVNLKCLNNNCKANNIITKTLSKNTLKRYNRTFIFIILVCIKFLLILYIVMICVMTDASVILKHPFLMNAELSHSFIKVVSIRLNVSPSLDGFEDKASLVIYQDKWE